MLLEKSNSDTTEVSNLMLNLNVTMQGVKTDWILIAALWNKFGFEFEELCAWPPNKNAYFYIKTVSRPRFEAAYHIGKF